jgi:citrate lyase subunit beta/citryl-CoA lyase
MPIARPRRSILFMPGANARAMTKARELKADGLIFDLEDSVAPEAKEAARAQITAALQAGGYGKRETVLRVNGIATQWHRDDLLLAAKLPVDAVLLPKVESAEDVNATLAALASAGAPSSLALWCMMETPLAYLNAQAIASSSERLAALVVGTEDLGKDLSARPRPDRMAFLLALQTCVLAARAYGLAPLDAVYRDFNDDAGFIASCRQGRDLGFDGKTLIHPRQIAFANTEFGPGGAELDEARAVIAAFDAAIAAGKGIATFQGKMLEKLHVDAARHLLAVAAAIAESETREA